MRNLNFARILKWTLFGFVLNVILTTIFLQGLVNFNDTSKNFKNIEDKKFYAPKARAPSKIQYGLNRTFMNFIFGERDKATLLKSKPIDGGYRNTSIDKSRENRTRIIDRNVTGLLQVKTDLTSEAGSMFSAKYQSYLQAMKNNSVYYLFPVEDGMKHDRILKQLRYQQEVSSYKTILLYGGFTSNDNMVQYMNSCEVKQCKFIADRNLLRKADAVFFHPSHLNFVNTLPKPMGQVWVFYQLESAEFKITNKEKLGAANSKFNFTATYRRDSVLVTPYEKFVPYSELKPGSHNKINSSAVNNRNYAANKTKMAAWFVSNCNARNGRNEYVKELQKYIQVDIYGRCGPLKCARKQASSCFDKLNKDYKFYLAFENSNCVDYITEKLYWNALNNDVVPVVMGARREDYDAVVPPHSVIHVDDFESPKHLADYLKMLNKNDALYNSYFKWKGTGEFINTKMWCRMCALLHATDYQHMHYNDLNNWWNAEGVCVSPDLRNGKKWSTWRNAKSRMKYQKLMLI